jgi:hypothetical protein
VRVLSRRQLTVALAQRQGLSERWRVGPAEAIRRLTPLQAQEPRAPFVALAARLEGFERAHLERALDAGAVVKTTINRMTLHLAAADDYPAYAQLTRQARLRKAAKTHPQIDAQALAAWFRTPRTNTEIRERMLEYEPEPDGPWTAVLLARTVLPLIQLPPAGHWTDPRRAQFVIDPRPLPTPQQAARTVLARYLRAFGPASRADVAGWAGVAQKDFDFTGLVSYRDEQGTELLDLPGVAPAPSETPLPPRFLANWDQPLLAYKNRDRIIPPELLPLQFTLSGAQTVTVDGRVAASWTIDEGCMTITKPTDFDLARVREEALRTARFYAPDARRHAVVEK